MKRTVSLILSVVLLATLIPLSMLNAFAATASGACGALSNWTFDEASGTLTISGKGFVDSVQWSEYKDQITTVIINEGITKITAPGAFYNYDNLTSVSLPKGLTDIGSNYGGDKGVFEGSDALTTVVLPDSLERLGPNLFKKCKGLTEITLPKNLKTIESDAFEDCVNLKAININSVALEDADYAFGKAGSSSEVCKVTFGKDVTVIPKQMFVSAGITHVEFLGNNLKEIKEAAFQYATRLTALHIPEGATTVGINAIAHCDSMKELTIPTTLKNITTHAFSYAYGLEKIYYNATDAAITGNALLSANSAFGSVGLYSSCTVYIGETVKKLPDNLFRDSKISYIVFNGANVKNTGECSFHGCSSLKSVVYPGTQEMWDRIVQESCGNEYCRKYIDATIYCTGEITEFENDFLKGDVNMNGKIDARDYLLLKRAYFGTFKLECPQEIADINGNGKIDARDYLLLKRAYFGTYTIE
ncbi:MAG: leucine-rich repeat protein [Clostridia bacterium]|nr:leucine-rich repeat protein [Clostridia bacterium]